MSYRTGIAALAIVALTLAPSVARAQAPSTTKSAQKVDDSTLDKRIETRLKADAALKHDKIDVEVKDAVVTLTGTVHSHGQSQRAERLAKIAGVIRVDNKLEVETAATTGAGEKAEKSAQKAASKTEKAMDKAADKTKSGAAEAGEVITDSWITTKIKTDFVGEDALKGSDINVDTNNHVVTLKGTVATPAGRARAMEIAKTTKGVTRVVDHLSIAPKK